MEQMLVFVYGTLKRGHGNHHWLSDAPFHGAAELPGAVLHDLGPFPMAVPGEGIVRGEVYGVDATGLGRLDRLEGCPRLYERRVLPLADGRRAWVYLGRPRQVRFAPPLPDGLWRGPTPGRSVRRSRQPLEALRERVLRGVLTGLLGALVGPVGALLAAPGASADDLATCNAWRSSRGTERILLGNAIGAAHFLTKVHRLQESAPEAPVALYAESDLARVCSLR